MAGVSRLQYASEMRLIRVMCSGRVDLAFVLRAFLKGADGVFIGGCHLGECNYVTNGNYDALNMVLLCRKIMEHLGLNPERLYIKFMSAGDGIPFAQTMSEFSSKVKKTGSPGRRRRRDHRQRSVKNQTPGSLEAGPLHQNRGKGETGIAS